MLDLTRMTAPRAASLSTPILYAPGTVLALNATFPVDYDLADKWVSLAIRKTKTGSVLFRLDDGDSGVSISSQVASFSVEPDTVNAISGGPTLQDLANANSTLYFELDLGADSDTDLTEYRIQGDITVLEPGAFSESSSSTSATLSFETLEVAVTLAGQGAAGAAGEGVPTGGTTGQILAKATGDNYDTEWITAAGTGDLLAANNLSDLDSAATARTNLGLGTAATSATTDFALALGPDDNYVTDAEKVVIGNTSGTNSGDQDLSGLQPKPAEGQFVDGDKTKLDGIESSADVTDATNVDASGAVMESDYTPAHSILVQQSGTGSPSSLSISNDTLIGRTTGGGTDITDLTAAQVRTLLNIEDGATADQTDFEILTAWENASSRSATVDGLKLDSIEPNATADQTDAEILAAVESESGRDMSVDGAKLDGLWGGANKLDATTAPTANDDAANTSGNGTFSVGSVWIDTTADESYRCADSTATAAVWVNTSLESGDLASVALSGSASDLSTGTLPIARIADGDITEAKLNASTNASLDLADSALQSADLTTDVTGTLPAANGGTGVTALSSLDAASLGAGASSDGQVLTSDGAGGAAWEDAGGGGISTGKAIAMAIVFG